MRTFASGLDGETENPYDSSTGLSTDLRPTLWKSRFTGEIA
jgi:hypothetical protein